MLYFDSIGIISKDYIGIYNMIEELFKKLNGAFAKNTIRAYRSDYEDFAHWCQNYEIEPLNHEPSDMVFYIKERSVDLSTATISRRIKSLSSIFRFLTLPDTTKHADVFLQLKKIKRQKGTAQQQAEPLTQERIEQLLPYCGEGKIRLRNIVMLKLGNETMRRRSELCEFKFSDIKVLPGERYAMNLRFSKTDQNGRGKAIPISKELYELLMTWKDMAGEGYILRGINKYNNIMKKLTSSSVNRIVQDIQARSDMETEYPFSGHSFRVGGALDLLMRGVTMEKIMLRGGWSSESTVIKYLRAWDLMDD